jgi:hypothetical protein
MNNTCLCGDVPGYWTTNWTAGSSWVNNTLLLTSCSSCESETPSPVINRGLDVQGEWHAWHKQALGSGSNRGWHSFL